MIWLQNALIQERSILAVFEILGSRLELCLGEAVVELQKWEEVSVEGSNLEDLALNAAFLAFFFLL